MKWCFEMGGSQRGVGGYSTVNGCVPGETCLARHAFNGLIWVGIAVARMKQRIIRDESAHESPACKACECARFVG